MKISLAVCAFSLALGLDLSHAQTVGGTVAYDQIKAGDVLVNGIGMGVFNRDFPLPPGDWQVLAVKNKTIGLVSRSDSTSTGSVDELTLTLKNKNPESLLMAMMLEFTPRSSNVAWNVASCTPEITSGRRVLKPDIGGNPDILFGCVTGTTLTQFPSVVKNSVVSKSNAVREYLAPLIPYADEFPQTMVLVNASASLHRGRRFRMNFFLKQEGTMTGAFYVSYLDAWMMATGSTLMKIANGNPGKFELPGPFSGEVTTNATASVPGTLTPAAVMSPNGDQRIPLAKIQIESRYVRTVLTTENLKDTLRQCSSRLAQFAALSQAAAVSATYDAGTTSNIFVVKKNEGVCIKRSATGFPIFATETFKDTINPVGVPENILEGLYSRMAMRLASRGATRIAYVLPNGDAHIANYFVAGTNPFSLLYSQVQLAAGAWETKEVDETLGHPALASVKANVPPSTTEGRKALPF